MKTGSLTGLSRVALVLMIVAGCAPVTVNDAGVARRFPAYPASHPVAIYSRAGGDADFPLEQPLLPYSQIPEHIELGMIVVSGDPVASWSGFAEKALGKARRLGGDAIVLVGWREVPFVLGTASKQLEICVVRYADRPSGDPVN
ncbi:MAG: hypothetical protein KBE65_13130 [Phycisphaerae bacterium]|nr:hypothetical protein [Phycisphaerae bacterium]